MTVVNRYSSLLAVPLSVFDQVKQGRWYHLGKRVFLVQTEKEIAEVALNCFQRLAAAFSQLFGGNYFARILSSRTAEKIEVGGSKLKDFEISSTPDGKARAAFKALPLEMQIRQLLRAGEEEKKACRESLNKEIEEEKKRRAGKKAPFVGLILSERYQAKTDPWRYFGDGTPDDIRKFCLDELKQKGAIADWGRWHMVNVIEPHQPITLVKIAATDRLAQLDAVAAMMRSVP